MSNFPFGRNGKLINWVSQNLGTLLNSGNSVDLGQAAQN